MLAASSRNGQRAGQKVDAYDVEPLWQASVGIHVDVLSEMFKVADRCSK